MSNYEIFVYGWIAIGFLSFPFILRYDAPYGRHTSNNWGPLVDNKIGWIVMELPALIVCPLLVFSSDNTLSDVTKIFIILTPPKSCQPFNSLNISCFVIFNL